MSKTKPIKLHQAKEILQKMHIGARVQRNGNGRGGKCLMWTDLKGTNYQRSFPSTSTWEEAIEFAQSLTPVWDKALVFETGDIIELEWITKNRIQAEVLGVPGDGGPQGNHNYALLSPEFCGSRSNTKFLTNYALKFHMKAIKVGEKAPFKLLVQ